MKAQYNPIEVEEKWYKAWLDAKCFSSTPDERPSYTVVIPPPNVTGVLHMGHMLNNTIQDVMVRRARMQGYNACWVPGTDHASIATEAKVTQKLKDQGISKWDISREEFIEKAWDWTNEHGGIILEQLKRLGASCDWDRTAFTLDEKRYESVIDVFVDLHNKGLIYKGYRMVNWDPEAKTTVSDEEVIHKDVNSKLYYLKYAIGADFMTVATTRPETILGDVALCVNPSDERYQHLIGKTAIVPIVGREIPIIADDYVDVEFGTGCLKITPAHDINDYEIGQKHSLEILDVFNADGTLNSHGMHYEGMDRFAVRKAIAKELEEKELLLKVEDYQNTVGTSERTGAVIEPRLSEQWFLNMSKWAKPALDLVNNDEVALVPEKFKNTYRHWMENIRDWCISRQLYWGHRIPAWYYGENNTQVVVAKTLEEAVEKARKDSGNAGLTTADLTQDNDVLDTWFSSWLWPLSVFDGIRNPNNEELNYYYPTKVLVTAPEILFFWVARMIMAGIEYKDQKPFDTVYLTGIVRDKQRRKMSKSLGNSPDPIKLMEQYGADGVRVGLLMSSPAGNDLLFDESLCEQGRNFSNKIWNALRLVSSWEVDDSLSQPEASKQAIAYYKNRFEEVLVALEKHFDTYRLSDAIMSIYKLVWDDFCSWYLEWVKPGYQQPIDAKTKAESLALFKENLKILHPFMPFLTEECWAELNGSSDDGFITLTEWPKATSIDEELLAQGALFKKVISQIRQFRASNNIGKKDSLDLSIKGEQGIDPSWDASMIKLENLSSVSRVSEKPEQTIGFVEGSTEYFLPIDNENVDVEAEIKKIEEELKYTKGFLKSVAGKLSNERFVNNAPEQVVATERKKQADAEARITVLEQKLEQFKSAS